MKNFALIILFLLCVEVPAQNTVLVQYQSSQQAIANPERGFYKHFETSAKQYSPLNVEELTNNRVATQNTLILRLFYLDTFLTTPISATYLKAIANDFDVMRKAGVKCIVRFAYSKKNAGIKDATKARMLLHIAQLKPLLISNSDVISVVQAGFIGVWGEWFYTSNFSMKPTAEDYLNRKEITTALLQALPSTRMIQLRTPMFKQKMYNSTLPLAADKAFDKSDLARIGHFNDCFLANSSDNGTYANATFEYPYLEDETQFLPMGGETCDLNSIRTHCRAAVQEMDRFHWTFMNIDFDPKVIRLFKKEKCFAEIDRKLGYRFELVQGNFPKSMDVSEPLELDLSIQNTGFATPYNYKKVQLVLRNENTKAEIKLDVETDPRLWSKSKWTNLKLHYNLSKQLEPGNYELLLHIADEDLTLRSRPEYAIQLANKSTWEAKSGYNKLLHSIVISNNSFIHSSAIKSAQVVENSIAFTAEISEKGAVLTLNGDQIAGCELSVYNAVGQKMALEKSITNPNSMFLKTKSLPEGVYLVAFKKGDLTGYQKISIVH